jgi:NAD(P)-dependent dehydrogenase (short-subunit alcohol dehydrogenase family)
MTADVLSAAEAASETVTLITGATRGIGRELARQLAAEHGHHVLLGARDLERGVVAAAGMRGRVEAVELDVTKPATIEALAARLDALDVLINNAGVELDPEISSIPPAWAAIEGTLDVNLLGPWRVTTAMVPLLLRSPHPQTVEEGVQGIIWLATLPDDGPTGRFFRFCTEAMETAKTMAEAEVPY